MSSMASAPVLMKKRIFPSLLVPMSVAILLASSITFLHILGNARFFVLLTFLFIFIIKKKVLRLFDVQFAFVLFVYLFWCFLTSFWSDIPLLSFMKSGFFIVTVVTLYCVGADWGKINSREKALDYLWMFALITLMTGFLGKIIGDPNQTNIHATSNLIEYQGFSGGSNMFGSMMGMSFPFLLWKMYSAWLKKANRVVWTFLGISCLYFLILSVSRSAILMVLVTGLLFIFGLKLSKKIILLCISGFIVLSIITVNPSSFFNMISVTNAYIYKSDKTNLFQSRLSVWQSSYDAALEGGWFGLGSGIAFGKTDFNFDHGLTTSSYGREKGNSQLAIIEETGIVGFILFSVLLLVVFFRLLKLYIYSNNSEQRILLSIVSGALLGMLAESVFEGWWSAPGAAETMYFWLLVGVSRSLGTTTNHRRVNYDTPRIEA